MVRCRLSDSPLGCCLAYIVMLNVMKKVLLIVTLAPARGIRNPCFLSYKLNVSSKTLVL